jgi:hypothetical protein
MHTEEEKTLPYSYHDHPLVHWLQLLKVLGDLVGILTLKKNTCNENHNNSQVWLIKITHGTVPERQKRSEKIMASIDDAISTNTFMACPTSDRNVDDDKRAADKGRNPLSCFPINMLNINVARNLSKFPKNIIEWTSEYQWQLREKEKLPSINY